jgi:hypothetical protein
MNDTTTSDAHPYPQIAALCGLAAIAGVIFVILADLAGSVIVDRYNPIQETISDLAAGNSHMIMDVGLQVFAAGMMLAALGLVVWRQSDWRWRLACGLLFLLGVDIVLIARRDLYGDGVSTGTELHIYFVFFLGIVFAAITWLAGPGLSQISERAGWLSRRLAVAWLVLAPLFFVVPDGWNGAYERFLALLMLGWLGGVAWLLVRHRHGVQT